MWKVEIRVHPLTVFPGSDAGGHCAEMWNTSHEIRHPKNEAAMRRSIELCRAWCDAENAKIQGERDLANYGLSLLQPPRPRAAHGDPGD